jgi:hypothetical protein
MRSAAIQHPVLAQPVLWQRKIRNWTNPASQIPKSEISSWTADLKQLSPICDFGFRDLRCRIRSISNFLIGCVRYVVALTIVLYLLAGASSAIAASDYVFPVFVDGATNGLSYRSTLKITNTSTTIPLPCTLTQRNTNAPFTGVDGTFYSADVFDGGFSPPALTQIMLDHFLPFEILRTNAQSSLKTGYAKLSCPADVQAELQFSVSDARNSKVGEATITPAVEGTSFQFLIDRRDGTRLGFSYVNDSAAIGQFTLIARDRFNYEVDRAYDTIESWSQVSRFVDEVLQLPPDFVGTIELLGLSDGRNYAVGFQFTGIVFTTIQPLVRNAPLSN